MTTPIAGSQLALSQGLMADIQDASAFWALGRRDAVFNRFLEAARFVNPHEGTLIELSRPDHVHYHDLRVGDRVYPAARVQDENLLADLGRSLGFGGLDYKGGIRFHEAVSIGKILELGLEMTLKNAVIAPEEVLFDGAFRLFMGGGKGGIRVNPKDLSSADLVALTEGFGRAFAPHLAGEKSVPRDVPAPDVNTNGRLMKLLTDAYSRFAGQEFWSVYTGKLLQDGGIEGRDEATARGGFIVLDWLLKQETGLENPFAGRTFVIDGFGNAGTFMAKIVADHGGRVVGFSDSRGAVVAQGDDHYFTSQQIDQFIRWKGEETRDQNRFDRNFSKKDLLALDANVLVLAAVDLTLRADNADRVRARYVIELGNGMTDIDADQILNAKGVTLIPDILANAGGVMVSGYEFLQGREWEMNREAERQGWARQKVLELMTEQLIAAARSVYALSREHGISLRTAADAKALRTLDRAYRATRLGEAA